MALIIAVPSIIFALALGVLIGIGMEPSSSTVERVFTPVGFVFRAIVPAWLWVRSVRQVSGFMMSLQDGTQVKWITDTNEWVAIFDRPDEKFGFSPLLLMPMWMARALVRPVGREMQIAGLRGDGTGNIVNGLRLANGVTLARRRSEDLAYLEENGRFPSTPLAW